MAKQLWKQFGRFAIVALASALFVSVTPAQDWQDYKRPAPTAADWAALAQLPDFTGVWESPLGGEGESLVVKPGEKVKAPTITRSSKFPVFHGPPPLPLTPAWAAKVADLKAHAGEDTSAANCLPPGMPEIMGQPYPYEFLMTPGQVTIVGEAYMIVRHIYTDGRPLPKDPDPTFFGSSVGHWEGKTLVVDSVGFSPATTIDMITPHSDKMRIVERFKLLDPDTMQITTTVIDPIALTHPYTTTRILKRHRDWTIDEYICEQNNRNSTTSTGKAEVNTTPPPLNGPASDVK
ncbi:MAG TPA: hypothetical protein VNK23_10570 [Candidatus Dormibacteraeota bacterium]|nr:hypothetical protein [Candidatus Dormibacteraeota bacterium]